MKEFQKTLFIVELDDIKIEKGFNVRRQFGTQEEMDQLSESLREKGLQQPLVCYKDAKDNFVLIEGERRYRAISELINQRRWKHDIVVDVTEKVSRKERTLIMLSQNDGKPLSRYEKGIAFARLREDGASDSAIARETGFSRQAINDCIKLVEVMDTDDYVREKVESGDLAESSIILVARKTKDLSRVGNIIKQSESAAAPPADEDDIKPVSAKNKKAPSPSSNGNTPSIDLGTKRPKPTSSIKPRSILETIDGTDNPTDGGDRYDLNDHSAKRMLSRLERVLDHLQSKPPRGGAAEARLEAFKVVRLLGYKHFENSDAISYIDNGILNEGFDFTGPKPDKVKKS